MRIKLKVCCGIIGAASLLTSPSLFASYVVIGTGTMTLTAPGYSGDAQANGDQAGPYSVYNLTSSSGVVPINGSVPSPVSSTGGQFETFCIGTQVDYSPPYVGYYQISDTVQPGGAALNPIPGTGSGAVGTPGFVTWGTAYLYSQYRAGAFTSGPLAVAGFGDGLANNNETDALQQAIWSLQGQVFAGIVGYGPDTPDATAYAYFMNLASTAATKDGITGGDGSEAYGAFGVYALNIYSGSGTGPSFNAEPQGDYAQPQLVLVPVPEPTTFLAGGLMLLPFGASALRIARKRLA
jgi:hypothetical protein